MTIETKADNPTWTVTNDKRVIGKIELTFHNTFIVHPHGGDTFGVFGNLRGAEIALTVWDARNLPVQKDGAGNG